MNAKKKLLVFHMALAPYRVDFFNALDKEFDASFYFSLSNVPDQDFDQDVIKKKCTFKSNYLSKGVELFGRSFIAGVHGIIKKEQPDIILCNEYSPVTFIAFLYKIVERKTVRLYTISDDSIDNSKSRKGIRALIRNMITKNIDGVIFPSTKVGEWFKKNISEKPKILELPIIHNDTVFRDALGESLSLANDNIRIFNLKGKKVILFVGRLVSVKNLPFLLEAMCQIKDTGWILVIVGDGVMMNDLKYMAINLGISRQVLFVGRKEGLELYAWYTLAQILVLQSTSEKFGAVVNEALLGGCKVLCSELAGASSLINAENGILFNPFDKQEFLTCIETALEEAEPTPTEIHALRENRMPFPFHEKINTLIQNL
ncbi:MAG: glycosyltransferase family 4 protein [Bacteroidota bacterium]|nr:glycosyltransferase family 4 protein [Bacteroidota bacterium]